MPKMIILVGPPGSGKSTLAKKYETEGFVRVSQDAQGKSGHQDLFMESGRAKKNILVDRMNFSKQQRSNYLAYAGDYETEIIVLHENWETCFKRVMTRTGHETIKDEKGARAALQTFFTKYERPVEGEANKITFVYPEGDKPRVIYSDLDGTLCDCSHRIHHVRLPDPEKIPDKPFKKNWAAFFAEIPKDLVNQFCLDILTRFSSNTIPERYRIPTVFCSGRDDNQRKMTVEWLDRHVSFPYELYMRNRYDSRQDAIVKEIILDFELLTRYSIYFCLDDRNQVVKMLRHRGLTVLQVAEGDF